MLNVALIGGGGGAYIRGRLLFAKFYLKQLLFEIFVLFAHVIWFVIFRATKYRRNNSKK